MMPKRTTGSNDLKRVQVTTYIPAFAARDLERIAERQQRSIAAVLRMMVLDFIAGETDAKKAKA